jgi:hypothetical protein
MAEYIYLLKRCESFLEAIVVTKVDDIINPIVKKVLSIIIVKYCWINEST